MQDLNGKVALVTGGAGGIGSGNCAVLAEQGATVIVGHSLTIVFARASS